jgi:hypothetical protein
MRKGLLVISICAVLLAGFDLWAQTEADVTGRITDPSGGAIPGAKITVTNPATNARRIVNSDAAGVYDVPALIPGIYTVSVEVAGFKTEVRTGIELQVQQSARLDFQMQVGQVTQRIEVAGNAIQVNTENAELGSVVENQRIVDLPLNGRDFLQLTALDANVSFGVGNENGAGASRVGGQRITEMISVAGGRTEFNYYTLDGISNTDVSFNTYTFLPSIDAIQEFKIQTGIFPAEFGRGTAEINVSTKPGTNNIHGALFEFVRNSSTDAQSYCFAANGICPPGNILHQNQFGGEVGGPVYIPHLINGRNKLFFMFDYEGYRQSQAVNESGSVMTAAQRQGDFTGMATIYDPNTRVLNSAGTQVVSAQTFASECGGANVIPNGSNCPGMASRLDPIAVKLLAFQPLPSASGSTNLIDSFPRSQVNNQYTARIDYNQSTNSTWFGRFSLGREVGTLINGPIKEGNDHITSHPLQIELSNVRTFSPTLVNDFRFGYNRLINGVLNYNSGTGLNEVGALGGIPGVATPYPQIYGVPSISISGLSGWGDDSGIPSLLWNNTFQFADTLSKVHGKHSIRLGADIRRDQFTSAANSFIRGAFGFNGQYTSNPAASPVGGVPAADYMLGLENLFDSALALAQTQLRGTSQAYFIDDTWKVTPKLTVSIGLRYEYVQPYVEKHDNVANILWPAANQSALPGLQGSTGPTPLNQPVFIRPGTGNFYDKTPADFVFGGGIITARTNDAPGMGRALYNYWKTDFAPRLGIAYSPTPNWVVRLGAGMFYTQDQHNIDFDPGRNLAARRQLPANQTLPNLTFENPLGGGATINVLQPFVLAAGPNMKTPYVEQYLIDVQRQISPNLMLTVGYLGNMGHDIQGLMDNNDPPVPGPGSLGNVPGSLRPYPSFGVIQTNSPWANSAYNGLSVRLAKKTSHGLSLNQVYTWSRAIDDDSAIRDHGGDTQFPQNPYNAIADRSLSIFHIEHRFVTSSLYELPVGKGRAWLNQGGVANAILGGWQLGGIITMQSGFPVNLSSGSDPANIGESGYERPSYTGLPVKPAKQTINNWINKSAFKTPAAYTFGNVGRNVILQPWFGDIDMNIQKRFAVHEGQYFELRFEGFNTTNHPNFGFYNTTFTSSTFGTITSAGAMRQLQLGLKFVF